MNDSGFFARVRSDARRHLPSPGYGPSTHRELAMVAPQTMSSRSPRTEKPADGDSNAARTVSPGPESPSRFEPITRRTSDSRMEQTEAQPNLERDDIRETGTAPPNAIAEERDPSVTTRASMSTVDDDTSQTPQRQQAYTQLDDKGYRPTVGYNEHEPLTTSLHEPQQVPEPERYRYVESATVEQSGARDTRKAGWATETDDSVSSTDVPEATEPRPTDNHRYTIGREQTETPAHSTGSSPDQRDVKPPRLHIGEVVIRIEEDPKPQRTKRRGRTSTPSDSQRLIRSL